MSDQQLPPMTVGTALEIVHGVAKRAYDETPYVVEAVKAEAKLALDTVEDFIANQFEEETPVPRLRPGERTPMDNDERFEMGSRPPEEGGQSACGKAGINHKMQRYGSMSTRCTNPGCDAFC